MVHTYLLCPPLYHLSLATLRAWDLWEAAELTYWICVVGSNTTASGTFKPTLKPASLPSTSTRLGVVRHGGMASAAAAAQRQGGGEGGHAQSRGEEGEGNETGLGWSRARGLDKGVGSGARDLTWRLAGQTRWRLRVTKW
jgi:hypothetical protein